MLATIIAKIRDFILDLGTTRTDTFVYTTSAIFSLQETKGVTIASVEKNGTAVTSANYSYSSTTGKLTITSALTANDVITITYTYYKYSDTELTSYIKRALMEISNRNYTLFEIRSTVLDPIPSRKEQNLISQVTGVIVEPDWTEYRLGNTVIRYNAKMTKEKKIEHTINQFKNSIGIIDIVESR
jgi:hypothetical protein